MSDANGHDNVTPLFPEPPRRRPRVRKLRLLVVLVPVMLLAIVSTVFGMMMAVASDLPALENRKEYKDARNSVLFDYTGKHALGFLTNNQSRVLVTYNQISPDMRNAIIAIEDRRFYTNSGVDIRGIARAFVQDVVQKRAVQGGSTITQQFVKNALRAQNQRTVFQKLREAALAYHLTRKWSKAKILTQYLNSIYFGNGAYGIESAARTYFGKDHPGCGTREKPCVSVLRPEEAALLAGVVANPTGYDPVAHPVAAERRRNLVLQRMFEQGRLGRLQYFNARQEALPADPEPPTVRTAAPYFTTWIRQQLVDRFGARRSFEGGLKVTTTLDADLQTAAENTVKRYFSNPNGPTAAVVALDNDSASPVPRSSRSSSPRRSGAGSAPPRSGPRASACSTCRAAPTSSRSTTSRAATRARTRSRALSPRRTTRSSPPSASRSARSGSRASPARWASGRRSPRTRR
jgi:penicillin-binding protein 1A